jgi:hypothetical protein
MPADIDPAAAEGTSTPPPDDTPPSGAEARAERQATTLPLIWMGIGAIAVAAFVIFAVLPLGSKLGGRPAAAVQEGPAPARMP